jgi:hypothetical protein
VIHVRNHSIRGVKNHLVRIERPIFTLCGQQIGKFIADGGGWEPNNEPADCRRCLAKLNSDQCRIYRAKEGGQRAQA